MAAAFISSVHKTTAGTITVPADTTLIVAVVKGSITPPQLAGIAMASIAGVEAQAIIPALSIHQWKLPVIGDYDFTFTGTWVEFVFLSEADTHRQGSVLGYNSGGVWTGTLPTTTADIVIALLCGSIGPTTLKGDTVALTYLVNTATEKVGYIVPGDSSLSCEAADTGVSEGYWVVTPNIWHAPELLHGGYWVYPKHWVEGHWESTAVWVPGYWVQNPYHWVEGHWEQGNPIWVNGHWVEDTPYYVPASYSDGYWEDVPDIWVPEGTSQISAIYVSIGNAVSGFIPKTTHFN